MAKIVISELDIDVNALLKSTAEVKNAIDVIKDRQKELTKSGQTASNQFIQNAADLKTLNSAYNSNLKALSESTQATADQANRTQLIALALNTEVQSIKEARDQNSILTKLRNEANQATEEGRIELYNLNKKLDENNEFIKENADAYLKQKINIGNYSESIKDALSNLNPLNGGLLGFIQRSQEAGGVGNLLKNSMAGVTQGIMGATKAAWAFVANPIGAVIAAIVVVVALLYNAFKQFQPVVDKVEQVFAGLSAVISAVKNTIIALVTGTKSLGEAFSGLSGDMNDTYESAVKLKKAQQDLEDAMKEQELQSAKNRAEINRLNIQAKDRTKSDEERIALLEKSAKLEEEDFAQRKKNSDEAVRQAFEQIRIEGSLTDTEFAELKKRGLAYKEYYETKGTGSDELFDKLQETLIKETDIQNEFYSNQEKNINKQNKLIEDAEAAKEKARADAQKRAEEAEARRQKILDDTVAKSNAELQLFLSQQGIKAKSLEDQLSLAESIYQQQLEINQKEFDASKKTATDKLNFQIANNEASNALLQTQSDLVVANAQTELNNYIALNQSKIDANKALTDAIVAEEKTRNTNILQEQIDFANLQLEQGVTNQKSTDEAIAFAKKEARLKGVELDAQLAEQKKEADLINRENQLAIDEENWNLELQTKLARLKIEQEAELENAKKTGSDKDLINQKYAQAEIKMRQMVEASKVATLAEGLSQAKGLFKENTVAYKALAIAEATINTYKAASTALATYAYPVGGIFAGLAIAQGLLQVGKIAGVKFEKGGIQEVGGNRHSAGGTKFYGEDGTMFEAEQGEGIGVLNRGAFASFMDFNNRHSSGGISTPTFMAGGGIITQGVQPQQINTTELAFVTADLIRQMPPPQVAVTDIHRESNSFVEVVDGANF